MIPAAPVIDLPSTAVPGDAKAAVTEVSLSQLWKKHLGDWVINPYVGCEHGCLHCYCPAMPGVKFFNHGHSQTDWGRYIFPKIGLVEALERQLKHFTPDKARKTAWGDGWILMSFLTDCYSPAEAQHKLTRNCIQRILEAGHKLRILTRSALVERDFDILRAHPGQVLLGTSLPHLDDALARILEPRATGPTRRLRMLEKAAHAGILTYCAIAPVYPFHSVAEVQEVAGKLRPLSPTEIFCEVLNPEGQNLEKIELALRPLHPGFADIIKGYAGLRWAQFTWEILNHGHRNISRFVAWPDAGRSWKKHLSLLQNQFLESFLPQ